MCSGTGFFGFFNSVVLGRAPGSGSSDITNFIKSDSNMEAVSAVVTEKLMNISQQIDQGALVDKKIIVKCNNNQLTDYHKEPLPILRTWYGAEIKESKCVRYGCCYDVDQSTSITFRAINEIKTEHYEELWNDIKQNIEHNVEATITDIGSGVKTISETLNDNSVKNVCLRNIEKHITNQIKTDIEVEQIITVESESPLRCINSCDESPTAGIINQNANIQVTSQNIVHDIMKTVTET